MTVESTAARDVWRRRTAGILAYLQPRAMIMTLLGFSAGLPYLLTAGTMGAWLTDANVDLTTIGLASGISFAYAMKFLWAPVVDHVPLPILEQALGRRRSWMLLTQALILASLIGLAFSNPGPDLLLPLLAFGLLVAFSSATQDIAVDAWRIEAAESAEDQGVLAGAYQLGYRIGMFLAGAGAFVLADWLGWTAAYLAMAGLMGLGLLATLIATRVGDRPAETEEDRRIAAALDAVKVGRGALRDAVAWLYKSVAAPFIEFFARKGVQQALIVLALVSLYRMPDTVMGVMANTFYLKIGFTKTEIAAFDKFYGVWITVGGAVLGGWAVAQWGLYRSLVVGAVIGAASNLAYVWLAVAGNDYVALFTTLTLEKIAYGFAGTALIAYMSAQTASAFTATQYAVFSSFYKIPGTTVGMASGWMVEQSSFAIFFAVTAILGVPAVLLSLYEWRRSGRRGQTPPP